MSDTKKCEHCGKEINSQYTVCPLCGGHLHLSIAPRSPICPRCEKSLVIHVVDNEEYHLCPSCGGMWLDRDEFQRATRESDVYQKVGEENTKNVYIQGPIKDPGGYIPCVRCGKLMNRKNFSHISGVVIDECSSHGVWLDAGELEKIRLFIADGGLEKAQDREIEKTKTELRELATRVEQTAFTHKLIHFWNFKRWFFGG